MRTGGPETVDVPRPEYKAFLKATAFRARPAPRATARVLAQLCGSTMWSTASTANARRFRPVVMHRWCTARSVAVRSLTHGWRSDRSRRPSRSMRSARSA